MTGGLTPRFTFRTDWDFFKNHPQFGAVKPTSYESFDIDRGFPQFNQNAMGLPEACTGMAQSYICACEDSVIADPKEIYDNTPPFDSGGRDIRASLDRITKVGYRRYLTTEAPANPRDGYYNIRATTPLDWFDAIYLACFSVKQYNRPVSVGVPWFTEFETPDHLGKVVLPTIPPELKVGGFIGTLVYFFRSVLGGFRGGYTWHNAAISGLVLINGEPHLKVYSWQGDDFGLNGAIYWNRDQVNTIFDLYMTEAFVCAQKVNKPETVDLDVVERIVGFFKDLLV